MGDSIPVVTKSTHKYLCMTVTLCDSNKKELREKCETSISFYVSRHPTNYQSSRLTANVKKMQKYATAPHHPGNSGINIQYLIMMQR